MGGDHGHSKMSMPDWRQWKVEGTPMEFTQQRLAARGLKDPWARSVVIPLMRYSIYFSHSYPWLCSLCFSPVPFSLQKRGLEVLGWLRSCCDSVWCAAERFQVGLCCLHCCSGCRVRPVPTKERWPLMLIYCPSSPDLTESNTIRYFLFNKYFFDQR